MKGLLRGALLLGALAVPRVLLREPRTLPLDGPPPAPGTVSVVVPARDEGATLPVLLRAVARLSRRVDEVVVVDDGSRDDTAAVARSGGARVVDAGVPPAGWTGKAWACHVGAQQTRGDVLVFLDADTELAPDALTALLQVRDRHGGLVSVQPFHAVERPHEQLSAHFNAVAVLASGAFTGRRSSRPMAFGPCLVTSRADYERVGGHAAVRGDVLDDVGLAVAYDRAGLGVRCKLGGPSVRMRSYPDGLRTWADGWTKNFASGATAAPPGPAVATVGWLAAQHAVAVCAVAGLVRGPSASSAAWAGAYAATAWQLRSVLRRVGSFETWTWTLFPLPLLAFDVVFARSVLRTAVHRSVRWRGRVVPVGSGR